MEVVTAAAMEAMEAATAEEIHTGEATAEATMEVGTVIIVPDVVGVEAGAVDAVVEVVDGIESWSYKTNDEMFHVFKWSWLYSPSKFSHSNALFRLLRFFLFQPTILKLNFKASLTFACCIFSSKSANLRAATH